MAEEDVQLDEAADESGRRKGGALKWIVISVLGLVLLAGAAVGAAFLLVPETMNELVGAGSEDGEAANDTRPPIYYPLEQPFIVNLASDSRRLLQVNVELMTRDPESVAPLERHTPVIRNNLLMLLSSKTVDDLSTREGKEALRAEALEEIRSIIDEQNEEAEIEQVYFTSMVIQ